MHSEHSKAWWTEDVEARERADDDRRADRAALAQSVNVLWLVVSVIALYLFLR